ncbi:unnamed protein product [Coregonus sp. 'balchen']|nr:unnamed protein product [Coregonus sp. 'balchen']
MTPVWKQRFGCGYTAPGARWRAACQSGDSSLSKRMGGVPHPQPWPSLPLPHLDPLPPATRTHLPPPFPVFHTRHAEQSAERPRLVTVVRPCGHSTLRKVTLLLNRRSVVSYEQLLSDISEALGLPRWHRARVTRLYTPHAREVRGVCDFFRGEAAFLALGKSRPELRSVEEALEELFPQHSCYRNDALQAWERRKIISSPIGPLTQEEELGEELDTPPPPRCRNCKPSEGPNLRAGRAPFPPVTRKQTGNRPNDQEVEKPHVGPTPRHTGPICRFEQESLSQSERSSSDSKQEEARTKQEVIFDLPSNGSDVTLSDIERCYDIGRMVGDGNFAVVHECRRRDNGEDFAVKIVEHSKLIGREHMMQNELSLLGSLSHPAWFASSHTTTHTHTPISSWRWLPGATCLRQSRSVECSSDGVSRLKLGDFGLAMVVTEPIFTVCGTPTYVAPEILLETDQYRPVQISTDQYRPTQISTDQQSPAQPSKDQHRHEQISANQQSPAKTSTEYHRPEQSPTTDQYRPAQTTTEHHRPVQSPTPIDQQRPAQPSKEQHRSLQTIREHQNNQPNSTHRQSQSTQSSTSTRAPLNSHTQSPQHTTHPAPSPHSPTQQDPSTPPQPPAAAPLNPPIQFPHPPSYPQHHPNPAPTHLSEPLNPPPTLPSLPPSLHPPTQPPSQHPPIPSRIPTQSLHTTHPPAVYHQQCPTPQQQHPSPTSSQPILLIDGVPETLKASPGIENI